MWLCLQCVFQLRKWSGVASFSSQCLLWNLDFSSAIIGLNWNLKRIACSFRCLSSGACREIPSPLCSLPQAAGESQLYLEHLLPLPTPWLTLMFTLFFLSFFASPLAFLTFLHFLKYVHSERFFPQLLWELIFIFQTRNYNYFPCPCYFLRLSWFFFWHHSHLYLFVKLCNIVPSGPSEIIFSKKFWIFPLSFGLIS